MKQSRKLPSNHHSDVSGVLYVSFESKGDHREMERFSTRIIHHGNVDKRADTTAGKIETGGVGACVCEEATISTAGSNVHSEKVQIKEMVMCPKRKHEKNACITYLFGDYSFGPESASLQIK